MGRTWWSTSGRMRQWGSWAGLGPGRFSRFFELGEVRLAILSLLSEGPKHGYQLMKELQERSGGLYRASAGSVYPTLQQLEDEGLIEAEQQEGKRVYRITEAGRRELAEHSDSVRRIWERAERWEDWGNCMGPEALGLLGPLAAVAKAAFRAASRAASSPDTEERIRAILNRTTRELGDLGNK
jgi:DNA-binding PadR family transcriptional regulator